MGSEALADRERPENGCGATPGESGIHVSTVCLFFKQRYKLRGVSTIRGGGKTCGGSQRVGNSREKRAQGLAMKDGRILGYCHSK